VLLLINLIVYKDVAAKMNVHVFLYVHFAKLLKIKVNMLPKCVFLFIF